MSKFTCVFFFQYVNKESSENVKRDISVHLFSLLIIIEDDIAD